MVQILPEVPSFGASFARSLGSGLSQGISQGSEMAQKMMLEKYKNSQKSKLISDIEKKYTDSTLQDSPQNNFADSVHGNQTTHKPDLYSKAKAYIAAGEPELAKIAMDEAKYQIEKTEFPKKEYIKNAYKSQPAFMEKISQAEEKSPLAQNALNMIEGAIEKGEDQTGIFDRLADLTGVESLRSTAGGEHKAGIKQYFMEDLSNITGRPNMFVEKQLVDAYTKMGRDMVSNQKILSGMKMKKQINDVFGTVGRNLEEKYLSKDGSLPPNFESIVRKEVRPQVEQIMKETEKRLGHLSKFQNEYEKMAKKSLMKNEYLMLSPEGDYRAVPKDQYQQAKESNYIRVS